MLYVKKAQQHDTLSLAHEKAYDDFVLQISQSSNLVCILILPLIQLNLDPNHPSDPTSTKTQL